MTEEGEKMPKEAEGGETREDGAEALSGGAAKPDLSSYKKGGDTMRAVWAVGIVAVLFVLWNILFATPATNLSRIKIQIVGVEKELAALHSAELAYKEETGEFTDDLARLDGYKKKRDAVTVTITEASGECYTAEARHRELHGAFLIDCTGKLSERFEEEDKSSN